MNIKLSLEDLEHICANPPGTCQCNVCTKYWGQVKKWMDSGYKI